MSTLARGVAGLGAVLVAVALLFPGNVPSFRAKVVAAVHDVALNMPLTEIILGWSAYWCKLKSAAALALVAVSLCA